MFSSQLLPRNYLSVFDHFVRLALNWLIYPQFSLFMFSNYLPNNLMKLEIPNNLMQLEKNKKITNTVLPQLDAVFKGPMPNFAAHVKQI